VAIEAGEQLLHYRLIEKIGEGGMGAVWKATDTTLDRSVAIKVLLDSVTADAERVARLEREARLLGSFSHPNIAVLHGLQEDEGIRFLVMELVEGEDLAQRLRRGRLSTEEALKIARQVAEALEAAHRQGVIHRDLKPANIKVTPEGTVKVLDFGLAKALESAGGQDARLSHSPTLTVAHTRAGVILGTAGYMAPEQVRGKAVDVRADVWAFGIVLYEMLSGTAPFGGETVSDTLARVLEREPEWERLPRNLPSRLQRLLRRCLSKDPNQRFQAIGDARIEIQECLSDPAGLTERASVTTPVWRRVAPWLLLPLALATGWWLKPNPARPTAPTVRFEWPLPEGERLAHFYRQGVAISPDGLTIAAVSGSVESPYSQLDDVRILVRRFDQWRWQEVPGSKGLVQPEFSPDGQWLAAVGGEDGKIVLRKLSLSGGEPTTLCECPATVGLSWGSDGTIAFAGVTSAIQLISSSGGEPREITKLDTELDEVSHRLPHFLPGSKAFLYTALRYKEFMDAAAIYVHSLDTGERKLLVEGATDARYVTSGHRVFAREGRLFAAPFDLDRLEIQGPETPLLDGINHAVHTGFSFRETGVAQFAVSPEGTLVYAGGSVFPELTRELVWVDREGNETPLEATPAHYLRQRLSRDGRTALLTKNYPPLDVWLMDLERGTLRRQTFEGNHYSVVWGPGPNQFTVDSDHEGPAGLYVKTLDSGPGDLERLATGIQTSHQPSVWSSDGKVLLYVVSDDVTHQDIWIYTRDDGKTRPWLATQFWERHPDLSPDGQWVAYSSEQSGRREVYVRPLDGEGPTIQVSTDGGSSPAWSKDGQELFYRVDDKFLAVSVREDGERLQVGAPVELFEGEYGGSTPIRSYDVSADGRFLLNRDPDSDALTAAIERVFPDRIQVVQGWLAELRP